MIQRISHLALRAAEPAAAARFAIEKMGFSLAQVAGWRDQGAACLMR